MIAIDCAADPAGTELGEREVTVGAALTTVRGVLPLFKGSWVEVAVTVAAPTPDGVNTPAEAIEPPTADHVTVELKLPVPATVAKQELVKAVVRTVGLHVTVIEVMIAAADTTTSTEPDFVESCVEVAFTVTVPVPE